MTGSLVLIRTIHITTVFAALYAILLSPAAYAGPREAVLSVYERLSGVPLVDEAKIQEYVSSWSSGDRLSVAKAATATETFTNITAYNFSIPIAYRDHSPHNGINDMAATIVGVLRDNLDARLILTGDFRYQGDTSLYTIGGAAPAGYSLSNNTHYDQLETSRINLHRVLIQAPQVFPVIAGVLTTRGWMSAHAEAGTNRRFVAEMFNCFHGKKMEDIANNTFSHSFIRRDVDRAPGGDTTLFLGTCSGCHAGMDAMTGATVKLGFANGAPYHSSAAPAGLTGDDRVDSNGILLKINRNAQFFPAGYYTTTDYWKNLWKDSPALGFPADAPSEGMGIASLAALFVTADAYGENLVKRAFKTICMREVLPEELSLVRFLASGARQNGYKMKDLFEQIALRPECSLIN